MIKHVKHSMEPLHEHLGNPPALWNQLNKSKWTSDVSVWHLFCTAELIIHYWVIIAIAFGEHIKGIWIVITALTYSGCHIVNAG